MTSRDIKSHGFLMKTYNLLETQSFKDIIDWNPQGTGFVIYDVEKLQTQVLPSYFKHSNFQSFVRQLNMYGFHKIRSSKNINYYTHDCFVKGDREKIKIISRKAQKKMLKKHEVQNQPTAHKNPTPQSNNLAILLKINMSLLEQQNFLVQTLKKQWEHSKKLMIITEQKQSTIQNNIRYRIQLQKTERSVQAYWNMQQQMYSKLYIQSMAALNMSSQETVQTHPSFSKI